MPESKFKAGKAILTVCLLVLLGALAYEFAELNRKTPLPPLPNPNGYDDFVKAQKLMIRAYELDRGQHLKSLNELVPDYLEAVPVDPATGTKLTN